MTVSGKDRRGLVEQIRTFRTRLDRLERRNAELVQVQRELHKSLEQFKTIFDDSLVGLYRTTPDGRILMANSALLEMLGYSSLQELAGRNLENEGYEPEYPRSAFKERIEREGKVIGLESAWKRSDGTTAYIRESAQAVRDESGHTLYYQGTVEDITGHRQTKKALQASEEMFGALTANLSEGVSLVDENLRFVFANPAGEAIFGVEPGGLVGRTLTGFVSDRDRAILEEQLGKRREAIASSYDLEIARPDGQERQLIVTGTPRFSADGAYTGAMAIFFDVTEKWQAEEALRKAHDELETRVKQRTAELEQANRELKAEIAERVKTENTLTASELQYRSTLDSMGDAIHVVDSDLRVVLLNERFHSWGQELGFDVADAVGRTVFELFPFLPETVRQEYRQVFEEGRVLTTEDVNHIAGREVATETRKIPIWREGQVVRVVTVIRDITERRQAEEKLAEAELRYRTVAAFAYDWEYWEDSDGSLRYVSPSCERITGYRAQEFIDDPDLLVNILLPEDRDTWNRHHCDALERRGLREVQFRIRHRDGRTRWIEHTCQPVTDADGKFLGFRASNRDVTERKQAEQALKETTGLLQTIFENTDMLVAYLDPQFNFVRVNRAYARADGHEPSFYPGRNHFDLFPNAENEEIFGMVMQTGVPYSTFAKPFEYAEHPERGVTYWDWSLVPIKQQDGSVSGLVLTLANVTERKQAERALQENEAKLISIFRAAPVGIGLECNRTLSRVNDQVCAMLGYSREELVGRHARMFYPTEEDYQYIRQEKHRQIRETGTATVETRWKRKDGRIIDVLLSTAVLDPADFSKGVTFTALDITGRKCAENALRESEEKFRSLAEQSPNMIFINQSGRIVYANRKCEEVMGYSREQLYSPDFNFLTLIAPESLDRIEESFAKHSRGEEVEPYDYSAITREGQRIEAINTSKLIQYENRMAILGIVTNITEFKKAERTLRESQERLKILFESAPDAIYLIDSEGRFVDGNRAAEELVGFPKAGLIGKSLVESGLMRPEDAARAAENLRKAAAGEPAGPSEYLITRKDGSHIAIETRVFPVKIGGRTLCLGIARDTTARKRVEEALRASEKKFRSIFETAANLITLVTAEGIVVDCNDRVREFLGYEKEEILGRSMAKIIHPDSLSNTESATREILSQGFSYNKEYKMLRKDGSVVDVSINSSAIDDEHGPNVRILCIIDNITERKQAQQKLLDDREQLKSLTSQLSLTEERERRRLATELHDHIGQSLVISKIKLDQLRKCECPGAMTAALNEVSHCLGQVIADTRTLTFDLSYPILYELGFEAAVADWLSEQVEEEHGVKTAFEDDGQPKPLDDDIRALLFRNVRELLINVIKHAQADHVKVSVRRADRDICVCVEDDGVGFDSVEVAAMAAKRAEFGLLSIRERLEQLGGHIEIESGPGRGTKITMRARLKCEQLNDGTQT